MKNKILSTIIIMFVFSIFISGCSTSSGKEENYTETAMNGALDAVGLPNISNFYERSQLKSIYELRDDPNLICYWYTKNDMSGKWVYEGTCMGYGIPYGASMTNSQKYEYSGATLDLAEPNGLYTNNVTSSATWILTITGNGEVEPQYVEQEIRVSQTKIDSSKCEDWSISSDY